MKNVDDLHILLENVLVKSFQNSMVPRMTWMHVRSLADDTTNDVSSVLLKSSKRRFIYLQRLCRDLISIVSSVLD